MRTLTSVQSATLVNAMITAYVKASDQSTTWTFDHRQIVALSGLSWEVPFGGGLGKPSVYKVTLSSSLQWIKTYKPVLLKAEVRLRIDVNRDTFYPHVGRVRQLQRHGGDPNQIELTVFDRLLDADPKIPVEALTNSYSTLHPEVAGVDMGYPLYYGRHTRPFYHTPVDCNIHVLLGPRNVSSANHVNSVWFNTSPDKGDATDIHDGKHVLLMNKTWAQQSGSTNAISGGYVFECLDVSATDVRIWSFENSQVKQDTIQINSQSAVDVMQNGYISAVAEVGIGGAGEKLLRVAPVINKVIPQDVSRTTRLNYSVTFANVTAITSHAFTLITDSGTGVSPYTIAAGTNATLTGSSDVSATAMSGLFGGNTRYYFQFLVVGSASAKATMVASLQLGVSLKSEGYRNYVIYSLPVNTGDIAISQNPYGILANVFDQASAYYVSTQCSQAQVDASSYHFQCFFAERQKLSEIVDDFGRTTSTYLWIGDSGMVNFRSYQESAAATVNATITTSDLLPGLVLKENPLGVSQYETQKAKRVKVNYGYNFQAGKYSGTLTAEPSSCALCNSAQASGIDTEITTETKYILESDTASYYLGNIVRHATQSEEFAEMKLPARFFTLELADVVKLQHPMLIGSQALYQVIAVTPDYINGQVSVRAAKLLSLNP